MMNLEKGAKERKSQAELELEKAAAIVEEFKEGRPMYYRSKEDRPWEAVTGLTSRGDKYGATFSVQTEDQGDSARVMEFRVFVRMQQVAAKEEASAFVKKTQERIELQKTVDKKDTSMEGKKRIYEALYRPIAIKRAIGLLTGQEEKFLSSDSIWSDFEWWSHHPEGEQAQKMFPGWKLKDFAEMQKIVQDGLDAAKKEMAVQLKAEGQDPEEYEELARKAEEAKQRLVQAAVKVSNRNGVVIAKD